jgi:hypothetical protein
MKLKLIIFILFFLATFAYGQIETRPEKYEIKIEGVNPDGSIVLMINGRRYRALTEAQMRNIYQTHVDRNYLQNEWLDCETRLSRKNEGE